MMRATALWQRNLLAAVVVTCAVGVYLGIDFGPAWSAYRQSQTPSVIIPAGSSGTAGGQTWRLTSVKHLNRNPATFGAQLPAGTVLMVLEVDRSGSPSGDYCTAVLTDGENRWEAQGIGGFSPVPPSGVTTLCHQPGPAQFSFLLPGDVVPTAMDVTHNGRITVRMLL
ncbi:hypothetical protein H7H73_25155 [Mycobacterium rufum]|uniref:Uncharacterized protein n=2 Tax=Mycolicibacterium rufum TaxID=318424 RepID=A0A9X2Y383_9MYCO|nr:hypothetical protein EU78_13390 [Mycolicibacterium rufum]MCV7073126.1 hypothetical protein [Mycolicibacterium rufum]